MFCPQLSFYSILGIKLPTLVIFYSAIYSFFTCSLPLNCFRELFFSVLFLFPVSAVVHPDVPLISIFPANPRFRSIRFEFPYFLSLLVPAVCYFLISCHSPFCKPFALNSDTRTSLHHLWFSPLPAAITLAHPYISSISSQLS